jgi:hypothetical protein
MVELPRHCPPVFRVGGADEGPGGSRRHGRAVAQRQRLERRLRQAHVEKEADAKELAANK